MYEFWESNGFAERSKLGVNKYKMVPTMGEKIGAIKKARNNKASGFYKFMPDYSGK